MGIFLLSLFLVSSLMAKEVKTFQKRQFVKDNSKISSSKLRSNYDSKIGHKYSSNKSTTRFINQRNREILLEQSLTGYQEEWSFGVSDSNSFGPYFVADNFTGIEGIITGITFYGLDLSNPWANCFEDPMDFDIIFYENDNGVMGEIYTTQQVTLARVSTGFQYSGFECFSWSGSFTLPVMMSEGWISIVGTSIGTPIDGWFLWGNSLYGDGINASDDGTGWIINNESGSDRALTFTGAITDPVAPASPINFTATPEENGSLTATLCWLNPSVTLSGDPLLELCSIDIYIDGEIVESVINPIIGENETSIIEIESIGMHTFTIVGVNTWGIGASTYDIVWIGNDIPNIITNAVAEFVDPVIELSWVNPLESLHNGPFGLGVEFISIVRNDGIEWTLDGIESFTDNTVNPNTMYSYTITPANSSGNGPATTTNIVYSGSQIPALVVDLDPNNSSAPTIEATLLEIGIDAIIVTELPTVLNIYTSIFVCLGVYSTNHVLTIDEGIILANYITNGGYLYMEGGDTWYWDNPTAVHSLFNINAISDGSGDLSTIIGVEGTMTDEMSFTYSGENNWIDHIEPIGDAETIFNNTNPAYGTAVAYDSGNYKTIGVSHEFGGLDDEDFTKAELMTAYVEFFGLLNGTPYVEYGDVDGNGNIEAIDASITLQSIVGLLTLEPWQIERADVDLNGNIQAIDAAVILQYVVGIIPELPWTDRNNNADVKVSIKKNELVFTATGNLWGFQVNTKGIELNKIDTDLLFAQKGNTFAIASTEALTGEFLRISFSSLENGASLEMIINTKRVNISLNDISDIYFSHQYPNPFNPVCYFGINSNKITTAKIEIFNIKGAKIVTLNEKIAIGNSTIKWNAKDIASGIYFYKIDIEEYNSFGKILLLK